MNGIDQEAKDNKNNIIQLSEKDLEELRKKVKEEKKKRKRLKITTEKLEVIRYLYEDKELPIVEISEIVGINNETIGRLKKQYGWEKRKENEEIISKIKVVYESTDKSLTKIAKEFGLSANRIDYLATKNKWSKENRRKKVSVPEKKYIKIRDDYEIEKMEIKDLVKKYGVSETAIRNKIKEEGWLRLGYIQIISGDRKIKKDVSDKKIREIKEKVIKNIGKKIKVKTDIGKAEKGNERRLMEYTGEILNAYRCVFEVKKPSGLITSFSYVDIFEKGKKGAQTEVYFQDEWETAKCI